MNPFEYQPRRRSSGTHAAHLTSTRCDCCPRNATNARGKTVPKMRRLVTSENMIHIGLCGSGTSGTTKPHSNRHRATPISAARTMADQTACELFTAWQNGSNQRLATLREPHGPILSRVRCIALLALSSQQQVILCVATNPNPNDLSIPLGSQRTMMQAYAS